MHSNLIFAEGDCKTQLTDKAIEEAISAFKTKFNISEELAVAQVVRWFIQRKSKLGSLLQYSIDVCADEAIGEEFYKKDETLLPFLTVCGTDNEEVKFINYVRSHRDAFVCKHPGCKGSLFGECPIMECEECGKQHFIKIDGITSGICKTCVANGLNTCNYENTCTDKGPSRITTIYMV